MKITVRHIVWCVIGAGIFYSIINIFSIIPGSIFNQNLLLYKGVAIILGVIVGFLFTRTANSKGQPGLEIVHEIGKGRELIYIGIGAISGLMIFRLIQNKIGLPQDQNWIYLYLIINPIIGALIGWYVAKLMNKQELRTSDPVSIEESEKVVKVARNLAYAFLVGLLWLVIAEIIKK